MRRASIGSTRSRREGPLLPQLAAGDVPGGGVSAGDGGIERGPLPHLAVTRITPSRGWVALKLREVWEFRELLYFLVWRDVKVRYKQTALGAAWAVIQPFLTMVVFTLFFGRLAKIPSDGIPYPIFSYTALLPWTYFAQALNQASQSLVGSANLIRRVYFPRLVIPTSGVIAGLVDFSIAFTVLAGMMVYFRIELTPRIVLVPVFVLLAALTALGVSLWLSALNVKYRDVRYIVPFLLQVWLFATPVIYPSSVLPEKFRPIFALNPMVGVIEGFRWTLLGAKPPSAMILISVAITITLLITGAFYFRRVEKTFADVV